MHSLKLISSVASVVLLGIALMSGLAACGDEGGGGSGGTGATGGSGQGGEGGAGQGGQGGMAGQGGQGGAGGQGGQGGSGGGSALCTSTGGTIVMTSCCQSASDFPDLCAIGACGCSPQNSHSIQTCSCPASMCFDPAVGCKAM